MTAPFPRWVFAALNFQEEAVPEFRHPIKAFPSLPAHLFLDLFLVDVHSPLCAFKRVSSDLVMGLFLF